MLVCHCHAVSERAIRQAVRNGAVTRRAIARTSGAGRSCQGCVPAIDAILRSEARAQSAVAVAMATAKAKPIPTSVELATS